MAIGFHGIGTWAAYVYAGIVFVAVAVLMVIKWVAGDHMEEDTQGNAMVVLFEQLDLNLGEWTRAMASRAI